MGSKKKKKDATYQVAVSGAKGAIRILLYVLLICVLIFVGKTAYSFGSRGLGDVYKRQTTGYLLGTGKTLRLSW